MRLAWLVAFSLLVLVAGRASADEVHLVGGARIEGNASRQGDKVVIQLESGQISLPASSVQRIEPRPSALDGAAALAARLAPDDVAGLLTLADYCRDNGLPARERESLERILELEPDHARARARLGYVRREGHWITHEEQMRLDGFVREGGQWLSREQVAERERMRAAREAAERERERARAEEQQRQLEQDRIQQELAAEARRLASEPCFGAYYGLAGFPPYWARPRPCHRGDCDGARVRRASPGVVASSRRSSTMTVPKRPISR